jgi:PAS domain-containing protein
LDITEIVRAQQAQKNFVQTLTKTFATLSIGLAIFDRNRQLMLFNPALIDLTALTADFLSARPNLLTAFDKLWDNQIMPETKICALEGKACHFGRGSNREDLHQNLEFTLRCNISDFWASAPRWRIGIFV